MTTDSAVHCGHASDPWVRSSSGRRVGTIVHVTYCTAGQGIQHIYLISRLRDLKRNSSDHIIMSMKCHG